MTTLMSMWDVEMEDVNQKIMILVLKILTIPDKVVNMAHALQVLEGMVHLEI